LGEQGPPRLIVDPGFPGDEDDGEAARDEFVIRVVSGVGDRGVKCPEIAADRIDGPADDAGDVVELRMQRMEWSKEVDVLRMDDSKDGLSGFDDSLFQARGVDFPNWRRIARPSVGNPSTDLASSRARYSSGETNVSGGTRITSVRS